MKIYQIHEHSGEYEDYCDRIIGSYLRKERAEVEKVKAEANEVKAIEQSNRCNRCPFTEASYSELNNLLSDFQGYCDEMELYDSDYGIECRNYYHHWDKAYFVIEEVEVEE